MLWSLVEIVLNGKLVLQVYASKAYFLICAIDKINKYCLVGKYKKDTRENMNSKLREITI
jgi:hypothetical protein